MRDALRQVLDAALEAADPARAVERALDGSPALDGRVHVVAVGKAAAAMAGAAVRVLGDDVAGGLVVTKDGYADDVPGLATLVAGHPEPDERSVAAAARVTALAEGLGEGDVLLALVSGGASALLADAAPGIGLDDLAALSRALLRSGASIHELNAVRKHVSTLKGGGLVRAAAPARVVGLLLSDVVGDDPSAIGSGLAAPDPTTLADVEAVLAHSGIDPPASVRRHLDRGAETPKPGDRLFASLETRVVGSGLAACEAAAVRCTALGYAPLLLSDGLTGPAATLGEVHAAMVRSARASGHPLPPPCALVSGGEATVVVRGDGTGGPNQEWCLAIALALDGVEEWAALAADTDGTDGPTGAAGGVVDGGTAGRARAAGVDPAAALARNDAGTALAAAGDLLVTGPTGTNVNDLRVVLVRRS